MKKKRKHRKHKHSHDESRIKHKHKHHKKHHKKHKRRRDSDPELSVSEPPTLSPQTRIKEEPVEENDEDDDKSKEVLKTYNNVSSFLVYRYIVTFYTLHI